VEPVSISNRKLHNNIISWALLIGNDFNIKIKWFKKLTLSKNPAEKRRGLVMYLILSEISNFSTGS
jgi:hypothetical protein